MKITIEVTPEEMKALVLYHCGQAKKAQNRLGKALTEERIKFFPRTRAMKLLTEHASDIVKTHLDRAKQLTAALRSIQNNQPAKERTNMKK